MHDTLEAPISTVGKLTHTRQLSFLDKAAIVTENKRAPNLWMLSTIHHVEELKSVIRIIPIWVAGIILNTAFVQQQTFAVQQGKTMDRHLTESFQIPAGSMYVFVMIFLIFTIVIYTRVIIPVARRFTNLDRGITILQRMGIGLVISILITLVAGFTEVKRKQVGSAHGLLNSSRSTIPMSIFWLVPQYALQGIAEAFALLGHLEFFYDQAPESMRSTAVVLFWSSTSCGHFFSSFLVSMVH